MAHAHDHGHDHAHAHGAPADWGRAFALGIGINVVFIVIEVAFGFAANSVALLADAAHNASDALGLFIAWVGHRLAARPPTARFTYGWRGSSILAALANALLLLVAVGGIGWEAILRFADPQPIASIMVIVVAAGGIFVNGATAWLFAAGRHSDLNLRGAFLHMAADAAVSAGVVAGALVIMATGWLFIDPAISLLIAVRREVETDVVAGLRRQLNVEVGLEVKCRPLGTRGDFDSCGRIPDVVSKPDPDVISRATEVASEKGAHADAGVSRPFAGTRRRVVRRTVARIRRVQCMGR